jgi:hypothetical protein
MTSTNPGLETGGYRREVDHQKLWASSAHCLESSVSFTASN